MGEGKPGPQPHDREREAQARPSRPASVDAPVNGAAALNPGRADQGSGHANGQDAHAGSSAQVIETVVSPFHCLYQDALAFHTQSHLRQARSESEASRLARASFLLYLAAAEALVHQAAAEMGRPELSAFLNDPARPLPLADVWRLLPAIVAESGVSIGPGAHDPDRPPWPQFAELLALRLAWAFPGPPESRRAYYRAPCPGAPFEPLEPHQLPRDHGRGRPSALAAADLVFPLTGLPRDPYALRPRHLDTARGVLDAAIAALDRRLGGALTRDQRHRREPVRPIGPTAG